MKTSLAFFSISLARLPSPKSVCAFSILCNLRVYTLCLNVIEPVKQNCIDCLSAFYMPKLITPETHVYFETPSYDLLVITATFFLAGWQKQSAKLGPLFYLFLRPFWRSKNAFGVSRSCDDRLCVAGHPTRSYARCAFLVN